MLQKIIQFIKKEQEAEKLSNKKKPAQTFPWSDDVLEDYIVWAFSKNYLLLNYENNEITGITIAYPLKRKSYGSVSLMLPNSANENKQEENTAELALMDAFFKTSEARKNITKMFMDRFPNWMNQTKVANRRGTAAVLKNKYFELLKTI